MRASSETSSNNNEQNLIGFLNDMRRLNVAITRPKFVLIIIGSIIHRKFIYFQGNSRTLKTNSTWRNYLNYLIQNKCYIEIPKVF